MSRNLARNEGKIVRDQMVQIDGGRVVRRVEAWVEIDGKERLMVFITNNPNWSPTGTSSPPVSITQPLGVFRDRLMPASRRQAAA